jgi:hypothetical protein
MKREDSAAFATELTMLAEVFGEKFSEPRLRGYFAALQDYSLEDVQDACRRAIKTSRFFPKPADLLEMMQGNLDDRAMYQWAQVMLKAKGQASEMDAVAERAVELMGGWKEQIMWLRQTFATHRDEENQRRFFLQMYRAACQRAQGATLALEYGGAAAKGLPDGASDDRT